MSKMNLFKSFSLALPAFLIFSATIVAQQSDADWNRFRGPNGSGISLDSDVPMTWSPKENIAWQVDLPGPGSSSPIIVGDLVFLTCYTGYGIDAKAAGNPGDLKRHLLCIDRGTGKEKWRATTDSAVAEDDYQGFIVEHGYASSTPVSDGEYVFVFYGKTGVVAYDMDGNEKWKTSVGEKSDPAKWGGGASLILHDEKLIVNAGIEGHALLALHKQDGTEAWRIDNPEFTNNWSTPILAEVDGHTELIYSAPEKLFGINPNDGQQLWHAKSPIKNSITASVVVDDGVAYTLGGREGKAIAIRLGGKGDVTDSHIEWTQSVQSSIGTPLVFHGHLYWLAARGLATCLDLKNGNEVNKVRLEATGPQKFPNGSYASPIIVDEKLLIVRRSGATHVLNATPELVEQEGERTFADDESLFNGTPAIGGGQIFIRSDKRLYCIAKVK